VVSADAPNWPQLLADATLEGVLIHEGGRILRVNAALGAMLRCAPEAMVGTSGVALTVPADRERLARHIAEQSERPLEGTALRADGTTFPCEIRGRTVRHGDRTLRVVLVRDISDRLAMEAELRQRERELASLAEHSPDVITRYDRAHRVRFMSQAVERATGVPPAAFVGKRMAELGFPSELTARWEAVSDRVFATGTAEEAEFEFTGPDGVQRFYHTRVVPERNASGEVDHVLTTTRDLTALKRADERAREAYTTLQGLIDQSLTGVYVIQDGRFAYVNARFAELAGFERREDVLALPDVHALVHPEDRHIVEEHVRRRLSGEARSVHYVFRALRRDGRVLHVEVHGSAAEYRGRPAIVGVLVDVTERLQLEERLRQTQKMEALGQLAGGVAHDFNNILMAISGYAQAVQQDLAPGDPHRADVAEVLRAAERGAGVTRQLLAFSRRQALETEVLDLGAVVRDLGGMLGQLLPRSVELRLPPAGATAYVCASRAQLEQIVVNLTLNGRDAMPTGGTLTLRVRTGGAGDRGRAVLEVHDTGHGMSPEVCSRAFEPFFTTKRNGQGTGLGLATVYGLVAQFRGHIDIESAEGVGTTVTVAFPLAAGAPSPSPGRAAEPRAAGSARILLVEDEPAIRRLTRRALERAGYEVVEAPHGAAALGVLRAGAAVDLLLTDVAMPELSGVELAREAAALRPALPVILMSGYAELSGVSRDASGTLAGVESDAGFIEKPFPMERLLTLVAGTLARSARAPSGVPALAQGRAGAPPVPRPG
jgi:PAS domain S-box-containing protein